MKISSEEFEGLKSLVAKRGSLEIRLVSGSMAPLLPTGSLARIEPCRFEELEKYDLVVFWYHGIVMCHCVWDRGVFPAANGERTLVTKGLANPVSDDPVRESWILGRVTSHATTPWQFNWNLVKAKFRRRTSFSRDESLDKT